MISIRALLIPVGAFAAAASYVHAASEALGPSVGATSMRSSLNGAALTTLVDRGFGLEMSASASAGQGDFGAVSAPLLALARDSFAVDPLEVSTIRTLALGGLLQRDEDQARRAMRLAVSLSKRDSVTNLWLAQDYGQAGDIAALTASFDNMLRTSTRARETAMKPLVDMLANPEAYAPLGEMLGRKPEWERDFWQQFVNNPAALQNAGQFFTQTGLSVDRLLPAERAQLYANLKSTGQFEALFALARLDPSASEGARRLAEGQFVSIGDGDPLGWATHSRGSYAAQVHRRSGEMQIDARSGAFGIAADRVFRLDRDYRLEIRMAEAVPSNASLELVAACPGSDGTVLARIALVPGARSGDAMVPAGTCAVGMLRLSFNADAGRRDAFLRIASIALRPN